VPLKYGLGVNQGQWKWDDSTYCVRSIHVL